MYTTLEVADQLNTNRKKILDFAKKSNLVLEKNANGGYLFSAEQVDILKNSLHSIKDRIQNNNDSNVNINEKMMNDITNRFSSIESELRSKANEVVNVQLLQHRGEIEDIKKQVTNMENQLSDIQDLLTNIKLEVENNKDIVQFPKNKKRLAILSFLGR
jgi:chromosome-anchoring protein RacA